MLERLLVALDKLAPDLAMVVLASGAMVRRCEMSGTWLTRRYLVVRNLYVRRCIQGSVQGIHGFERANYQRHFPLRAEGNTQGEMQGQRLDLV